MNLASILDDNARGIPALPAVICGDDGRVITHGDFLRMVNRFGNVLLELGVGEGEWVALFSAQLTGVSDRLFCRHPNRSDSHTFLTLCSEVRKYVIF